MQKRYIANYNINPCQCQKISEPDIEGDYRGMEECVASTGCKAQQKWKPVYDTDKETCQCVLDPIDGEYISPDICTMATGCPEYIPDVPGPWYVLEGCDARYGHDKCNEMQYKCKGYETLPSDFLEEVGGGAYRSLKRCLFGYGYGHPYTFLDASQNEGCGICNEADCKNARERNLLKTFEDPNSENTWPNFFACKVGGGVYSRARSWKPDYFKGKDAYGKPFCNKGCCNIMSCL